ncbi:unnamed protein product [Zymoseptoria tritici ST99CH_3D1]|nr:unnamed protein product [Zymoseptoria tritici ST99CH_3D1]
MAPPTWHIVQTCYIDPANPKKRERYRFPNDTKHLIIPVCHRQIHWTVAVVHLAEGLVETYDSLDENKHLAEAEVAIRGADELLQSHSHWKFNRCGQNLKQRDQSNCGIFVIFFALCTMHSQEIPDIIDCRAVRHVLAKVLSIQNSSLVTPSYVVASQPHLKEAISGLDHNGGMVNIDAHRALLESLKSTEQSLCNEMATFQALHTITQAQSRLHETDEDSKDALVAFESSMKVMKRPTMSFLLSPIKKLETDLKEVEKAFEQEAEKHRVMVETGKAIDLVTKEIDAEKSALRKSRLDGAGVLKHLAAELHKCYEEYSS